MSSLHTYLQGKRKELEVNWDVLEKDYILSWILTGISKVNLLNKTLIFKGGTALKKCYFGDYRFSEDLDFSTIEGVPRGKELDQAMLEACKIGSQILNEYAPVQINCMRYREKNPHPNEQEAFTIRAQYPWQSQMQTTVKVEITTDEDVFYPVVSKKILHGYEENIDAEIQVYSLEEIVAEKLRAILQHTKKIEKRGWSRSRARDYYDLWQIFRTYQDQLDLSNFLTVFRKKCDLREVTFSSVDDFFKDAMVGYVEKTWEKWLGALTLELPPFEKVSSELKPIIRKLIES
ncbi:MAG: nucleotidyl transferase AbiEii/AbiGii toxin family protein [Candidatus Margulisbacteria bacterium]|nr:nucleotidyl transferase AbiEii/AbiGii toxin family protein [Candidatus Margulisiibacteriota bacterium]